MLSGINTLAGMLGGSNPYAPTKISISVFLDDEVNGKRLKFNTLLNPEKVKFNRTVCWQGIQVNSEKGGKPWEVANYTGSDDAFTLTVTLDASENSSMDIQQDILNFYYLTVPLNHKGEETVKMNHPPFIKVSWGGGTGGSSLFGASGNATPVLVFTGWAKSLDVDMSLFTPTGQPVRASVTLGMAGVAFYDVGTVKGLKTWKGNDSVAESNQTEFKFDDSDGSSGLAGALGAFF